MGAGASRFLTLLTVRTEQIRAEGQEKRFEAATVLESLAQERHQVLGHVPAAAAFALGEGEDPGGVFVAAGAGRAVLSDAGLLDQGERAFEQGPEGGQLGQEGGLELRQGVGFAVHDLCMF